VGLLILGVILIVLVITFTLNGKKQVQSKIEVVDIELANGEVIELTKEEAELVPNKDEKKVILTDLGMT
jgi:hypothetical protein